jgi:hypothetical protein
VFVKVDEREEARRLRREQGLGIKTIAAAVGASPSTVGRWVRDVPLTPGQEAALRAANPIFNQQRSGTARFAANARARRAEAQEHGRALARRAEALHQLGCMLYWAEGSKARNRVIFTNSDADMVALFLRFLRESYAVPDDRLRLTINVHLGNGLALGEIEAWWLSRLGLPEGCLCPSAVNRTSRASQRKRRTLVLGTARLVVCSVFIVQSIYGAIQEYAGFARPEWLD